MAVEIQHFTATIPAHTPIATPVTVTIQIPVREVVRIEWRVPPGPMGVLGWQVAMGGVKVFPTGGDKYVLANGESSYWDVHDAPDSGAWQVIGYNTGANPHSVYLAFHCNPLKRAAVRATPIPAPLLMPVPDLSLFGPPLPGRMLCG